MRSKPSFAARSVTTQSAMREACAKRVERLRPIALEVEAGGPLEVPCGLARVSDPLDAKASHLLPRSRDEVPNPGLRNQPERVDDTHRRFSIAIFVLDLQLAVVPDGSAQRRQEFERRFGLVPTASIEVNARARLVGSALMNVGKPAAQLFERPNQPTLQA